MKCKEGNAYYMPYGDKEKLHLCFISGFKLSSVRPMSTAMHQKAFVARAQIVGFLSLLLFKAQRVW